MADTDTCQMTEKPEFGVRLERFQRSHPHFFFSPPSSTRTGAWRVFAPGVDPAEYRNRDQMMDELESRYGSG